jgi:hypothetical protein
MSEGELAEFAVAASKLAEGLSKGLKDIDSIFKDSKFTEDFENLRKEFDTAQGKVFDGEINFSVKDNKLEVSGKILGETITTDPVKAAKALEDFSPSSKNKEAMGNLKTLYEKLGINVKNLDTETSTLIDKYSTKLRETTLYKERFNLLDIDETTEKSKVKDKDIEVSEGEEPRTETQRRFYDEVKEKLKDMETEMKKKGETESEWGNWVRKKIDLVLLGGLITGGIFGILAVFKEHQKEMNGCWLVRANGSKCKVKFLTCDGTLKTKGGLLCDGEDEIRKNYICAKDPCEIDTSNSANFCGNDSSSTCSSYCDSTKFKLNPGESLQCVNVSILGAGIDLLGQAIKDILNALGINPADFGRIIKYFLIGVACLVGLFILYKIYQFLSQLFSKNKSQSEIEYPKQSQPVIVIESRKPEDFRINQTQPVIEPRKTENKIQPVIESKKNENNINTDRFFTPQASVERFFTPQNQIQPVIESKKTENKIQPVIESKKTENKVLSSFGKKKGNSRGRCNALLRKKISINMGEMKSGRYVSPSQALAVSYSQIKTKYPSCKQFFRK